MERQAEGLYRVEGSPNIYNVFDEPKLFQKFAALKNAASTEIAEFADQYGLLGLSGWFYQIPQGQELLNRRPLAPKGVIKGVSQFPPSERGSPKTEPFLDTYYSLLTGVERSIETASFLPPDSQSIENYRKQASDMSDLIDLKAISTVKPSGQEDLRLLIKRVRDFPKPHFGYKGFDLYVREVREFERSIARLDWASLNAREMKQLGRRLKRYIDFNIAWITSSALEDIVWSLSPIGSWTWTYQPGPPSLLPALYLQLVSEFSRGAPAKLCANKNCPTYFLPSRSDKQYCSTHCKEAAKKRRQRQRGAG